MFRKTAICARYLPASPELTDALQFLEENKEFSYVVMPLFHPGFDRDPEVSDGNRPISRSCRALDSGRWNQQIVGEISRNIDVDSENAGVRKRSEKLLLQELNYAVYVNVSAVLIRLTSHRCVNLARIVSNWLSGNWHFNVWILVPLFHPSVELDENRSDVAETHYESPWEWWNSFRSFSDHQTRIGVILDVGPDLPPETDRARWMGELVRGLFLRTSTFLTNKSGFPVLSPVHKSFLRELSDVKAHVILAGPNRHKCINHYVSYINHVWNLNMTDVDYENADWYDVLQTPLQPLFHNLEAQTYEIFEKDPVKYKVYRDAVQQALTDRVPEEEKDVTVTVIMVMGAGRGPLVQASLEAAVDAERKVRVYAVEKNPYAIMTLQCRRDEEWKDRVTVIAGDMRRIGLPEKADIIVSELLGSFGDNELSPECLDGAQQYLKDDGISIPKDYTSYICPVMSHKLFSEARQYTSEWGKPQSATLENTYVALQKNKLFLDKPQPLFKFSHPNRDSPIDNSRYESRTFHIARSSILHGFTGFFETTLYKSHMLSIVPDTFSPGMFSWFPLFMPLMRPVQLSAGCEVTGHFWRVVGEKDVWYEWTISAPEALPIHNPGGRAAKIGL